MAMRGLPDLSYGTPVVRPAGIVSQDTGAGDLFRDVADAADQINANFIKPRAAEEAQKEGERAVTRDAQGNIVVQKRDYLLPFMDEAYENAAQARYLTEKSKDLDRQLADAHMAHALNPDGFEAAVSGLKESHLGNLEFPDLANKVNDLIDRQASQHLANIRNEKFKADIASARGAIDAKLQDNANDLYALAEQGALQSEEAQQLLNDSIDLISSKVNNPAFVGYTSEQADLDIREFKSELEAGTIVGQAERIFRTEGAESAAKWLDEQINDTGLELSPETRDKIQTAGLKRINELAQEQNQALTEARDLKFTEMNLQAELGRLSVKQVNAALAAGQITPAAARSLHDKIIQSTTEDVGLTEALGRLANGLPMDPQNATDRKATNKAYDALVGRGMNPLQATVNMAVTNGIIPDKPMSQIRAAGLSNDPRVVVGGMGAGVAVIENAPDAFDRMPGGDSMARDIELYRHLTRDLGFAEQDAAGRLIQQRDPAFRRQAEAVLEVERPNINKLTADDAMAAMGARGTGFFGSLYNLFVGGPNSGFTSGQASQMASDYRAFVTERLKETGDLDSAKNTAGEDMRRTYGSTTVFGEATLMKFPPERRYPKINGSWDYIKQQALEDARAIMKNPNLQADDVVLMPDSATANDWANQGVLPRYGIGIRTEDDTIVTLPNGYFVADPKKAPAGPNPNAAEFQKERTKAFSIEKALKGAREAGPVY